MSFGQKQNYMPPLSQITAQDNLIIDSRSSNSHLSTLIFTPHPSNNNPPSNSVSCLSENSCQLSELLNTKNTIEPQNINFIDQTTESDNHLRNELLPLVDNITNRLTNMLDSNLLNIEQSGSTASTTENIPNNPASS
ncbi:unnamed protein product [Adineta steineri]|uniref:Uncharacterized protein n=1 Tax=Adineta steineri TaxID=433720 RepID=A0A819V7L9_9BILA|nr:unnamed protein product [Adineta steineri]